MARSIFRTGESDTARVEAFSDGVLAIVITLLILDIRIPETVSGGDAGLWAALRGQLPMLGAWVLSFFFVLVFWVTHHYFFKQLEKIDRGLLWLNGLFLLAISFTPFPTALLGLYPSRPAAATLLACAMFFTSSSFSLMRWYATRHAKLFAPDYVAPADTALRRTVIGPCLYFLAILAAQVSIATSVALMIAVPLTFFIPQKDTGAEV
jgi:uncharacterized membrane protein